MAFLYSINDLVPCPLSDMPAGAVLFMLDGPRTPLVKLDAPERSHGFFLALDKKLSIVSASNMGKLAQCLPPGELRISVQAIGGRSKDLEPGSIALSADGPVVNAHGRSMGFDVDRYVSLTTWQFTDLPAQIWQVEGCEFLWRPADVTLGQTVLLSLEAA